MRAKLIKEYNFERGDNIKKNLQVGKHWMDEKIKEWLRWAAGGIEDGFFNIEPKQYPENYDVAIKYLERIDEFEDYINSLGMKHLNNDWPYEEEIIFYDINYS